MTEKELNALIPYILAQFVEEMGGKLEVAAEEVLKSIKSNNENKLAVSIKDGRLYVELVNEG